MRYPYEMAESLDWHVRRNYFRKLSPKACHLYVAIRWIERSMEGIDGKSCFCKPVCVNYRDMADAANIDIKSVRPALEELAQHGLVKVAYGDPNKAKKIATTIQRMTQDELKAHSVVGDDHHNRLAQALNAAGPYVFNGKNVTTSWEPKKTGRVYASGPFNFQKVKGKHPMRFAGLKSGLQLGQVLAYADIKAAEPGVIKHCLDIPQERDFYSEYAQSVGVTRDAAKEPLSELAYCKNSMAVMLHWAEPLQDVLHDYAAKLDAYKKHLVAQARREQGIRTLSGRWIPKDKRERIHAGQPLAWLAQGTIADIINPACLHLMVMPGVELVLPVHDAVYAILPADRVGIVVEAIMEQARKIGLPIELKTEAFYAE